VLVAGVLIVVFLVWLGYQQGHKSTPEASSDDPRDRLGPHAERREGYAEARNNRLAAVSSDAKNWIDSYLEECESPAEARLLKALATEYALLPARGVLKGATLTLHMQVDWGPYRLDFLVNDWLVIEVDGAEFHASPEQVARDSARDKHLQSACLTVLRLPATAILYQPDKVLADVRKALAVGRRAAPASAPQALKAAVPPPAPPANVFSAFARGVHAVGDAAEKINGSIKRAEAVQTATLPAEKIFFEEKLTIDSAFEIAASELSIETYIAANPEQREMMQRIRVDLVAALGKDGKNSAADDQRHPPIPNITEPAAHSDPSINQAIRERHFALMQQRAEYFASARVRLKEADSRTSAMVRSALFERGHWRTWRELSGETGNFLRMPV
jgi:very-short-patch-repair endonuclease